MPGYQQGYSGGPGQPLVIVVPTGQSSCGSHCCCSNCGSTGNQPSTAPFIPPVSNTVASIATTKLEESLARLEQKLKNTQDNFDKRVSGDSIQSQTPKYGATGGGMEGGDLAAAAAAAAAAAPGMPAVPGMGAGVDFSGVINGMTVLTDKLTQTVSVINQIPQQLDTARANINGDIQGGFETSIVKMTSAAKDAAARAATVATVAALKAAQLKPIYGPDKYGEPNGPSAPSGPSEISTKSTRTQASTTDPSGPSAAFGGGKKRRTSGKNR